MWFTDMCHITLTSTAEDCDGWSWRDVESMADELQVSVILQL